MNEVTMSLESLKKTSIQHPFAHTVHGTGSILTLIHAPMYLGRKFFKLHAPRCNCTALSNPLVPDLLTSMGPLKPRAFAPHKRCPHPQPRRIRRRNPSASPPAERSLKRLSKADAAVVHRDGHLQQLVALQLHSMHRLGQRHKALHFPGVPLVDQ